MTGMPRTHNPTPIYHANCLCTWFRFDRDTAGVGFGAQSLQEQGQDPIPSRFCNCRAEMPLEWVAIR